MRVNEVPVEIVNLVDSDASNAIFEATQKYGNNINIQVPNVDYTGSVYHENTSSPTAEIFADIFFRFDVDENHTSEFYIEVYYELDDTGVVYSSDSEEDIVYKVLHEVESRIRYRRNAEATGRRGYRRN